MSRINRGEGPLLLLLLLLPYLRGSRPPLQALRATIQGPHASAGVFTGALAALGVRGVARQTQEVVFVGDRP
jgi:hypothetical protein